MHEYLKKKWKTEECGTTDCWCRMIVPVNPDDKDDFIIPSGSINKEIAEHIVSLHNANLKAQIDADTKFRISLNNSKTIK